jgi:RND superfamily putative drug exporter
VVPRRALTVNTFVVGRIFQEARRLPVRDAVAVAVPRASQAITTAGLALSASFAVLAVIRPHAAEHI